METTEGKSVIVRLFPVISHVVSTRSGHPTLFLQLYWGQDRERSDYDDNHAEGEDQKAVLDQLRKNENSYGRRVSDFSVTIAHI
jgi:hypothetical protein